MHYKDGQWAKTILALQQADGLWGNFHSLSQPSKGRPLTTEQALRRLENLGYGIDDACIARCIDTMEACLAGHRVMPDLVEKSHNWTLFTQLMLATWIKRFTDHSILANAVAQQWADIIGSSFKNGEFHHSQYLEHYQQQFGEAAYGGRMVDWCNFYQVSLVAGSLSKQQENDLVRYLRQRSTGLYYLGYSKSLAELPETFQSKQCWQFLSNIDLLANYRGALVQLQDVADWLDREHSRQGDFDLGSSVRDNIQFPMSDTWRNKSARLADCEQKIRQIRSKLQLN